MTFGRGGGNVRCAVVEYVYRQVEERQVQAAGSLNGLILLRSDYLAFSNNVFILKEFESIIRIVCTNLAFF